MDQKEFELQRKIISEYKAAVKGDSRMARMKQELEPTSEDPINTETAWNYGKRAGKHLEQAFLDNAQGIVDLQDGYAAVKNALEAGYDDVADFAADVLTEIDHRNGVGLNGKPADFSQASHSASAISNRISNAETVEDAEKEIRDTVQAFTNNAVGDTIESTADFHSSQGMGAKISRTAGAGACKWCLDLAGSYVYPCDREVYRRHADCSCVVEYLPVKGAKKIVSSSSVRQNRKSMTPEEREAKAETQNRKKPEALSRNYVNKEEQLYKNLINVKPVNGFEDFGAHGTPSGISYTTTNGIETNYTAKEFAEILKNDPAYHGGNIRLLSCSTGQDDGGFAEQLANELKVSVMAPTETLWTREDGELFISNSDILAEMWYDGEEVNETGTWRIFKPKEDLK